MNDFLQKISFLLEKTAPSSLRKASKNLSALYLQGKGSKQIFEDEAMRLCYLSLRVPAIHGVIKSVLPKLPVNPTSFLDLGAGPGTASWAASSLFSEMKEVTLIERNSSAIALGKELAKTHPLLQNATWIQASLPITLPKVDVAILSYSLNEIAFPFRVIEEWWKSETPFLVLIEPGTPRGFTLIKSVRDQIRSFGGHFLAPCPHSFACPLKGNDWCHFSIRIQRSKLHRYLKEGDLGYEDEKYSYLIASRYSLKNSPARILRSPKRHSNHVQLPLCMSDGTCQEINVGRGNPLYRQAKEAKWGDSWPLS